MSDWLDIWWHLEAAYWEVRCLVGAVACIALAGIAYYEGWYKSQKTGRGGKFPLDLEGFACDDCGTIIDKSDPYATWWVSISSKHRYCGACSHIRYPECVEQIRQAIEG